MTTTELATRDFTPDLAPRMVISLSELRDNLRELEEFKRSIMVPDVDYGQIPGTPKPTLLKPGAEKLSLAFGLAPSFDHTNRIEDWERGFFHYEERCILTSRRSGQVVASANGSANSRETRYRWRDAKPTCPECAGDLRRSKRREGSTEQPGWYCWAKTGGCGAQWPAETVKAVGRIENPEPWELANTILKMAQKRALVAAVLIATGGSGIWTQDVEDLQPNSDVEIIDVPIREREVVDQPRPKPSNDIVSNADDRLWQRWLELKGTAEGLGVPVEEIRLPMARTQLTSAGVDLNERITERRKQLASEDASRPEPMVISKTHPLWKEWLDLENKARGANLPTDTSTVRLPISEESLKASIASLRELLAEQTEQVAF